MWIWILLSFTLIQPCRCQEESNHAVLFSPRDGKGWGWDSDKTTFFDVALTALAFLSFGVFLLNLLLNALLFPSVATGIAQPVDPILTMISTGPTGGPVITSVGRRKRRQVFSPEIDDTTARRLLANFVTKSIETMAQKHECLPKVICEGSRQASVIGRSYQFLFSFFSLSISYLGRLLKLHNDLPSHLNAMSVGARNENCAAAFPLCSP